MFNTAWKAYTLPFKRFQLSVSPLVNVTVDRNGIAAGDADADTDTDTLGDGDAPNDALALGDALGDGGIQYGNTLWLITGGMMPSFRLLLAPIA